MEFKKRKLLAQELVEFLLVAPFIIIIFGILTEYAYALNLGFTLTNGLKTVSAQMYAEVKPNSSISETQKTLRNKLITYMKENNVPEDSAESVELNIAISGDTALVTASYTYIPAFTLPQIYINFMPEKLVFRTNQLVSSSMLKPNTYDSEVDSRALDGIWNNGGNEKAAANYTPSTRIPSTIFFVPADQFNNEYYLIVYSDGSSDGYYLKNSGLTTERYYIYTYDSANAKMVKSSTKFDASKNRNAVTYIIGKNFINQSVDFKEQWAKNYSAKISDSSNDGALKMALAIAAKSDNLSAGNFDNIDVAAFNSSAASSTTYNVKAFGGQIAVYPQDINAENFIDMSNPQGDFW